VSKAAFPRLIQIASDRPSSGMLRVARNNKAHTRALPPPNVLLQPADLFGVITAAAHMPIPQDVRDAVGKLYSQLGDKGIIISDRRWEQSLDLLRAHALLEQRSTVDSETCRSSNMASGIRTSSVPRSPNSSRRWPIRSTPAHLSWPTRRRVSTKA
jgi:hypothetical protein